MKVAIMQPYFFPYIGYFQLLYAVDKFVFYDDVNFIKGGWINKNYFLLNRQRNRITIPCLGISSFKKINEVDVHFESKEFKKILTSLRLNYKKAPYFHQVFPIIEKLFSKKYDSIATLSAKSISLVVEYLGMEREFCFSSVDFNNNQSMEKSERIIDIMKRLNASIYINPLGGEELYRKEVFSEFGIELKFLKSNIVGYKQYNEDLVEGLSIIDCLMFNSRKEVIDMLKTSSLI